jgi:hypothetical protein
MLEQTAKTWWKEAEEKGLQQGLQTGEARLLLRLVEQRFGPPSPEQRARIEAADADRLLRWGERVLAAPTLEDLLGS